MEQEKVEQILDAQSHLATALKMHFNEKQNSVNYELACAVQKLAEICPKVKNVEIE